MYVRTYGPYAFGIMTFVLGYWGVISPLMDKQAKITEAQMVIITSISKVSADLVQATSDTRRTSEILQDIVRQKVGTRP